MDHNSLKCIYFINYLDIHFKNKQKAEMICKRNLYCVSIPHYHTADYLYLLETKTMISMSTLKSIFFDLTFCGAMQRGIGNNAVKNVIKYPQRAPNFSPVWDVFCGSFQMLFEEK